jgi:hypothetical protein
LVSSADMQIPSRALLTIFPIDRTMTALVGLCGPYCGPFCAFCAISCWGRICVHRESFETSCASGSGVGTSLAVSDRARCCCVEGTCVDPVTGEGGVAGAGPRGASHAVRVGRCGGLCALGAGGPVYAVVVETASAVGAGGAGRAVSAAVGAGVRAVQVEASVAFSADVVDAGRAVVRAFYAKIGGGFQHVRDNACHTRDGASAKLAAGDAGRADGPVQVILIGAHYTIRRGIAPHASC